jgi:hypothetical protein
MLWPLMRKYRGQHGRWPRIIRPRAFTEKVLNRMLFDRRPILPALAGKLESREYVRSRLGEAFLIPLLGTIERAEELRTIALPDRFFLKANHGSGMNRPHFGGPVDRAALEILCGSWLANNPAKWGREWVYKDVRRAVLLEPLLQDANGEVPADYKLFCYDGQVRFVTVIHSRFVETCGHIMTRDWRHIPGHIYFPADPGPPPPRPRQLPELIAAAETLSAGFDFLRIDLYLVDGRPLFGEITTTPGGAHEKFNPPALDLLFGEPWTISRSG